MSTPGVSLFQGTESIKVNTSLERAEEEEALEDQRRRNEELGNLLQNAFDDLDDDETTVDSTSNFQAEFIDHKHSDNRQYGENHLLNAGLLLENELQQLKLLVASKDREVETFKQVANSESKKRDEIHKRLTIAEAELDRALASKKNTHELLVESKEKCSNLESVILKLKNEKKILEGENNSLLGKLETAQTLLSDVQRKYDMVERDLNRNNDRNAELKRKTMEERHRAEIEMMQQQIDQIANKLDKKSIELENMSTRYKALQNSHETMLVDKASKINDLNNALNEAQKKCEELLSKQNYFQENVRLQKLVASLQNQIIAMEQTIATLNERLEFTTSELDVMDSVLHQHNMDATPRKPPNQTHGSTPLNTVDRVGSLKDELFRALANVKNKREEIKKLQRSLEERNTEIKLLKDEENKSLVQITTLKEDKIRLENRVKVLEDEFDELRSKSLNKSANSNLNILSAELHSLREEKNSLEQRCKELEREKITCEAEHKKLDQNLKNVEVDLEELKQEYDSMRSNYENLLKDNQNLRNRSTADVIRLELEKHKFLLKDAQTENDRLKNLYIDIQNAKECLSFELEKLRCTDSNKKLLEEQEKVESLQRALKLAELKCEEITKIFEQEKICHEHEIATLKEKYEEERKNNMKDMKNNTNECKKCIEQLADITKFEIETLKLKNQLSTSKKDADSLEQQLKEAKCNYAELSDKLKMSQSCQKSQEVLIIELQKKASQFAEYMKSQSSSSDKSISPKRAKPATSVLNDKSVPVTLDKSEIKKIEARTRDEMAKLMAVEIKRHQIQLQQSEEQVLSLQNDISIMKQAILCERQRYNELLVQKDLDCKAIIQQTHDTVSQKYRDELQAQSKNITSLTQELNDMKMQLESERKSIKAERKLIEEFHNDQKHFIRLKKYKEDIEAQDQKIKDLKRELNERHTQIEKERQSMKAVMAQYEAQRKSIDAIETEWSIKFEGLKKEFDEKIKYWQSEYSTYKRTAVQWKNYAKEKESHFEKEFDRIKASYHSEILKLEEKLYNFEKKYVSSMEAHYEKEIERIKTENNMGTSKLEGKLQKLEKKIFPMPFTFPSDSHKRATFDKIKEVRAVIEAKNNNTASLMAGRKNDEVANRMEKLLPYRENLTLVNDEAKSTVLPKITEDCTQLAKDKENKIDN